MSIGSSRLIVSMSRAIDSGVSVGKAEDVAGPGHDMRALPGEQHVAIFPDLVLPLLRAHQRFGIDVLKPDEDGVAAGPRRLLDEARNPVAERVDLQQKADPEALILAQFDQPVEDRLPVAVAGEIVVGDEEARDALRGVGAHDRFHVVRRAVARLAPLHVDDRAEGALERAAAPRVEARVVARDLGDHGLRQHRDRGRRHIGHVVEEIVDRLRRPGVDVLDELGEPALALAGIKDDAELLRLLEIGRQFGQHGDAARHVEAADRHRHAAVAELPGDVERAGELVRLHADQRDHAPVRLDAVGDPLDVEDRVALVIGLDNDLGILAENMRLGAFDQEAVDAGEAVRGNRRAAPLDDIAVVVVMRRLDQDDRKLALGQPKTLAEAECREAAQPFGALPRCQFWHFMDGRQGQLGRRPEGRSDRSRPVFVDGGVSADPSCFPGRLGPSSR